MRMDGILTTLVLHRRDDGSDTQTASLRSPFATNPLEQWLRAILVGRYQQAPVAAAWSFELIANLYQYEVESDFLLSRSDHNDRDSDEVTIHNVEEENNGECTSSPTVAERVDL